MPGGSATGAGVIIIRGWVMAAVGVVLGLLLGLVLIGGGGGSFHPVKKTKINMRKKIWRRKTRDSGHLIKTKVGYKQWRHFFIVSTKLSNIYEEIDGGLGKVGSLPDAMHRWKDGVYIVPCRAKRTMTWHVQCSCLGFESDGHSYKWPCFSRWHAKRVRAFFSEKASLVRQKHQFHYDLSNEEIPSRSIQIFSSYIV